MSAAVLATTLYNVSGLSLLLGFASAMETFCGQAYGARNYKLVGVVLQRGMVSAGRRQCTSVTPCACLLAPS